MYGVYFQIEALLSFFNLQYYLFIINFLFGCQEHLLSSAFSA